MWASPSTLRASVSSSLKWGGGLVEHSTPGSCWDQMRCHLFGHSAQCQEHCKCYLPSTHLSPQGTPPTFVRLHLAARQPWRFSGLAVARRPSGIQTCYHPSTLRGGPSLLVPLLVWFPSLWRLFHPAAFFSFFFFFIHLFLP